MVASLNSLGRDDLVRILTEPKNAMSKQYKVLMSYDGVDLEYEPGALEAIADKAIDMKIGARGLRSVMEGVMDIIRCALELDDAVPLLPFSAEKGTGRDKLLTEIARMI